MPGPGTSSKFIQRCVSDVMDQGKDKEGAFAICTAQSQKSGYTKPRTRKLTGKGKKAEKRFAKKADMADKAADYEAKVKGEDRAVIDDGTDELAEAQPRPSLRAILEAIAVRSAQKRLDTTP